MQRGSHRQIGALVLALGAMMATSAHATLALTAAGIADGFTLSTFATLNPGLTPPGLGPFGVAYAGDGKVLVSNFADFTMYSFANTDGQTPGTALNAIGGGFTSGVGMASAGGHAYGLDPNTGYFAAYNSDGTIHHDLTGVASAGNPVSPDQGMAGNPINGHILSTSAAGIIEIDPLANGGNGSYHVVVPSPVAGAVNVDGVSVSPDGTTVEVVLQGGTPASNCVNGYNIGSGALVSHACGFAHTPDGVSVISGTKLNGDLVVNNRNGEIDLYDLTTQAITAIADGGVGGDYASADPTNGTLLLDYIDIIGRLGLQGGGIGTIPQPPPGVSEPASIALLLAGLTVFGLGRRRKEA